MTKAHLIMALVLLLGLSGTAGAAETAAPGTYGNVDPQQAQRLVLEEGAVILDVRTQAEFVFVGHPVGAVNIPLQFWDETTYAWSENPDFDARVRKRFPQGRPLITLCRSGHRSKAAAQRLVDMGYTRVFNMVESFEGDADPVTGLRTVNGWKNRRLPYTYQAGPEDLYRP
jgi:rhodanese-related sulfurtransferase